MGTTGSGTFENDEAQEWLGELDWKGIGAIVDALHVSAEEHAKAREASCALAAAEIVAAASGHPCKGLPAAAQSWLEGPWRELAAKLVPDALAAVREVARPGTELREMWEEPGDGGQWVSSVRELESRLARI